VLQVGSRLPAHSRSIRDEFFAITNIRYVVLFVLKKRLQGLQLEGLQGLQGLRGFTRNPINIVCVV
jgi:hypothetical protein